MNRISQWFQADTNSSNDTMDERYFIRERILTAVLIGAALLGAIAYYINVITATNQGNLGWIAIYTLAMAWICAIAFIRRIPYTFRVFSLLVILYALGIISALQFGAAGDTRVWLFGVVVMSSIFLGLRVGVGTLLFTMITYLGIGWLMSESLINIPDPGTLLAFDNFDSWTTTSIPFFAINAIIVVSIGVLINGLNASIGKNRELAEALSSDQEKLQQRSIILERREIQIRTAAEISRTAVAELDPEILLQKVANLVQSRFDLYYVGIFIVDDSGHYAVLRAGTGEAGQKMLERNHNLAIGSTSMVGYAISRQEAQNTSDGGENLYRFENPELPDTRSELAIPLISSGQALGALSVQSDQPNAFDQDDIVVLQGIADSLATALENANLFHQLQESLKKVQTAQRQYIHDSWKNLSATTKGLSHTYERSTPAPGTQPLSPFPPTELDFPLILRDQMIGMFSLEADRPHLTPQEKNFIESVIQQTALALENIRLVEETQRAAQQDRIIGAISEELSRAMDVENVIKTAVRELGRLPSVREVSIHIEPDQR